MVTLIFEDGLEAARRFTSVTNVDDPKVLAA